MDRKELEETMKLTEHTSPYDSKHTDESLQSLMGFRLKPKLQDTINLSLVKTVMRDIHHQNLKGQTWENLDPKITCTTISNAIKDCVKDMFRMSHENCRYKYMVQTFLSKSNSQAVSIKTRCIWDVNTDRLVFQNYIDENIVCSSEVIFIFYY